MRGFAGFSFDLDGGILSRDGVAIPLSPKAAGVLICLVERAGRVVSKETLLDAVWGEGTAVADKSLSEAVGIVRQALEDHAQQPRFVQTVHRRGYRFVAEVTTPTHEDAAGRQPGRRADAEEPAAAGARQVRAVPHGKWLLIVAGALLLAAAWYFTSSTETAAPTGAQRVLMALPENIPLAPGRPLPFVPSVAISSDGQQVAYVSTGVGSGPARLYVKRMDQFDSVLVPGTEGATSPFFSPDGEWIGFFAGTLAQRLMKVRVSGGLPVPLAEVSVGLGGVWYGDSIYYSPGHSIGLHRVGVEGGEPQPVTTLDRIRGEEEHVWPQVLPDGDTLLFVARSETELPRDATVELLTLSTGDRSVLLRGSEYARFLPSGHLLYLRDGELRARQFDVATRQLGDEEVRLLQEDAIGRRMDVSTLAVSESGTLIGAPRSTYLQPVWLEPTGEATPLSDKSGGCRIPDLSPDGTRIAFNCTRAGATDIFVYDLARDTLTRLTRSGTSLVPIWAPDGSELVYGLRDRDEWAIGAVAADGSGDARVLLRSPYPVYPQAWDPGGDVLVYLEMHPDSGEDLRTWSASSGTGDLIVSPFNESGARISPDGKWLAYHSDDSGGWTVFVQPFPELGPRLQISSGLGGWPTWAPDGRELLYLTAPFRALMVADMSAMPSPGRAAERFEFDLRLLGDRKGPVFDVTAEGRLISVELGSVPPTQLHLILEWDTELAGLFGQVPS